MLYDQYTHSAAGAGALCVCGVEGRREPAALSRTRRACRALCVMTCPCRACRALPRSSASSLVATSVAS